MRLTTEYIASMEVEGFRWQDRHGFYCGQYGYWLTGKHLEAVLKIDVQEIPRLLLLSTGGLGKYLYKQFYQHTYSGHTDSWIDGIMRAALRARLLCTIDLK